MLETHLPFNQQRLAADPSWPPSALMIAFPLARRVRAVGRIAERMAHAKSREKGEDVLAAAIRRQRAAIMRKGVPAEKVDRECVRLESAERTRLLDPTPNDAA
jgi:Family of unknown function (DUF6074)